MPRGCREAPENLLTAFVRIRSSRTAQRPRVARPALLAGLAGPLLLALGLMFGAGVAPLVGVAAEAVVVRDLGSPLLARAAAVLGGTGVGGPLVAGLEIVRVRCRVVGRVGRVRLALDLGDGSRLRRRGRTARVLGERNPADAERRDQRRRGDDCCLAFESFEHLVLLS